MIRIIAAPVQQCQDTKAFYAVIFHAYIEHDEAQAKAMPRLSSILFQKKRLHYINMSDRRFRLKKAFTFGK